MQVGGSSDHVPSSKHRSFPGFPEAIFQPILHRYTTILPIGLGSTVGGSKPPFSIDPGGGHLKSAEISRNINDR